MFERGFFDLRGLSQFFSQIMTIHRAEIIAKKQVITKVDDVNLQAKSKTNMCNKLGTLLPLLEDVRTESCPKQTQTFSGRVQFFGHIVSDQGFQPALIKARPKGLEEFRKLKSCNAHLRSLGFYSTFIKIFHVDSKPSYELLRANLPIEWTKQQEKVIQKNANRIS